MRAKFVALADWEPEMVAYLNGRAAQPGEAGVDPEVPQSDDGVIGNPWRGVRMQNIAAWKEQRRSWGA